LSLVSTVTCRICGEAWSAGEYVDVGNGHGCPSCGGSPLCARCGHQEASHRPARRTGEAACDEQVYDFEVLAIAACECPGYAPRAGGGFGHGIAAAPQA
jgi:hypothetical protein